MSYVETELIKLFDVEQASDALAIMSGGKKQSEFIIQEADWFHSGGESYILPCSATPVDSHSNAPTNIEAIFKASVSMNSGAALERAVKKRELLRSSGVRTPQLYAHGNGVVLEQTIPLSLEEAHKRFGNSIFEEIAKSYGILAKLGFQPVANGLLRDFRGDQDGNMYMIDFGGDLGSSNPEPSDLWSIFEKELDKYFPDKSIDREVLKHHYLLGKTHKKNNFHNSLTQVK